MSATTEHTDDAWRAELTPRSRASRRRWTVLLTVVLAALGASALSDDVHDAVLRDGIGGRGILIAVLLLVVFGLLRRGTRRLGAIRGTALDERDTAARHRAFRTAFVLFLGIVVVTLWVLPSALPDVPRRFGGGTNPDRSFLESSDLSSLTAWFLAWAVFLPTAALAWREPDAPEPDLEGGETRPVLGEAARDAWLAAAIALGAVASALLPDDRTGAEIVLGVAPIVVLVCVVGALRGRRDGLGPARAAAQGWRVALAFAIVVVALGAAGVLRIGA